MWDEDSLKPLESNLIVCPSVLRVFNGLWLIEVLGKPLFLDGRCLEDD